LKATAGFFGSGASHGRRVPRNVKRANGKRRACTAPWEGKSLQSESRTWLWGETNPQKLLEEQTVEDVRNVENGTEQAWDACDGRVTERELFCEWTPAANVAMGKETSRKVLGAGRRRASRTGGSERERSAREE